MKDFIKEFWNGQAREHGAAHSASWGDEHMVRLELENIGRYIRPDHSVLDVGCSNGYAVFHHLDKAQKFTGVDFAEDMIAEANKVRAEKRIDRASFEVGDVRQLRFADASFDLVYTTRVLINLPTWQEQIQGFEECLRVTKPGGIVLFSEAFWEPLVLMNALRALVQLPPLVEHDFNRYIKKSRLEKLFASWNQQFEVVDFSSVYYLGSRFVRELVTNPSDYPGYSNPINGIFYEMERNFSGGGMGIQQLYALKKA